MSPDEGQEELEEVQAELKKKDEEVSHGSIKYPDQKSTQLSTLTVLRFVSGCPSPCDVCGPPRDGSSMACRARFAISGLSVMGLGASGAVVGGAAAPSADLVWAGASPRGDKLPRSRNYACVLRGFPQH